uniref:Polyprotein n=1 Tax=Plumleaf crab apple waikavirus TaxID=3115793 RepID=A0AAT9J7X8_9SECO
MSSAPTKVSLLSTSGSTSCAHIYDPVTQLFLADDCASCTFANSLRAQRRRHPYIKRLDWDLQKVCDFHNISLDTFADRLSNFVVGRHASLAAYQRFSVSMFDNLPHLHGHFAEVDPTHSCGGCDRVLSADIHRDRCLDSAAGCYPQYTRLCPRLAHSRSEGSSTTSWTLYCSKCRAGIFQAGLGGQIMLLDLAHNLQIDFAGQRGFWIGPRDGSYSHPLSFEQADRLAQIVPFCFSPTAFRAITEEETVSGEIVWQLFKVPRKCTTKSVADFFDEDLIGNLKCKIDMVHDWHVSIPCMQLDLPIKGSLLLGIDHMIQPSAIMSTSRKSVRAANMWGISGYAPRINEPMLESFRQRNQASRELAGELGWLSEASADDLFHDIELSEDEEDGTPTAVCAAWKGENQLVDSAGDTVFWDESSASYYKYDIDNYAVFVPEADVFEEEDEELPLTVTYERLEDPDAHHDPEFPEGDDPAMIGEIELKEEETSDTTHVSLLTTSIGESIGGLLVSQADHTEYLHNLIEGPCAALNDSVRNFGTWLMGREVKARLRPADFPDWVNKTFEPVTSRLIHQLEDYSNNLQRLMVEDQKMAADFGADLTMLKRAVNKIIIDLKEIARNFGLLNQLLSGASGLKEESVLARLEQVEKKLETILDETARSEVALNQRFDDIERKVEKQLEIATRDLTRATFAKIRVIESRLTALERQRVLDDQDVAGDEIPVREVPARRPSITGATSVGTLPRFRGEAHVGDPEGSNVTLFTTEVGESAKESKEGVSTLPNEDDTPTILRGEYVISTFEWKTDQAVNSAIHTIHFPSALVSSSEWLESQVKLFQYMRMTGCEIEIAWTSNAMQGGVLFVCWDSMSAGVRRGITDLHSYSNCDSLVIQAGSSAKSSFYVQFDSVQNKLSLSGYELGLLSLGTLVFIPMCPLVVPSNTTQTVQITVLAKMVGGEFLVRTIPHKYQQFFEITDAVENQSGEGKYVRRMRIPLHTGVRELVSAPTVRLTGRGRRVPRERIVLAQATDVGNKGMSGMLKDAREGNSRLIREIANENVLHTGTWKGSDKGLLFTLNVHPCFNKMVSKVMVPTSLSMISSLYHFWRGTLVYRIYLGCNVFTTGKLHAVALPARMISENPTSTKQLINLGGVIFDLDHKQVFYEVEVPFYGIGSWQRTQRFSMFDSMFYGEDLVTRLFVSVVDPLITNVGATDSVHYCVTVQPGRDFQLKVQNGILTGVPSYVALEGFDLGPRHKIAPRLIGDGLDSLLPVWGHFAKLKLAAGKGMHWKVAPLLKTFSVSRNPLSMLASLFVRWRGSMRYKFIAPPHLKTEVKILYVWMMVEDPDMKEEYGKQAASIPPSGGDFLMWDLSKSSIFEITIPYVSRFESLCLPHAGFDDTKNHPSFYYSGSVYFGNPTKDDISITVLCGPGSDLTLFSRGPLCTVGESSGDFSLAYIDKFTSVEKVPVSKTNALIPGVKSFLESGRSVVQEPGRLTGGASNTDLYPPDTSARVRSQGVTAPTERVVEKAVVFYNQKPNPVPVVAPPPIPPPSLPSSSVKAPEEKVEPKVSAPAPTVVEKAPVLRLNPYARSGAYDSAPPKERPSWASEKAWIQYKRNWYKYLGEEQMSLADELSRDWRDKSTKRWQSEAQAFPFDCLKTTAMDKVAGKIIGAEVTGSAKVDVSQFAEGVTKLGALAKDLDIAALNGLIGEAAPFLKDLKRNFGRYDVVTNTVTEGVANFNGMADYGRKILEILKSCYSSSSIAWVVGQKDDGNMAILIAASLALLVVGGYCWRHAGKISWIEKIAVGIAIIWLPLLGLRALDLLDFLKGHFAKALLGTNIVRDNQYSRVPPPGEAHGFTDWVLDLIGWSDAILGAIFAMGCLLVLGCLPDEKKMKSWTDSFHGLGKKASSLNSISRLFSECGSWAKTISEKLITWINKMRGERMLEADEKLSLIMKCDVGAWVKRTNELSLEENKWTDVSGEEKIAEIRGLFDQGQLIQSQLLKNSVPPQITAVIRDTVGKVGKLINETYCARGLGEPRVDPIHIAFIGAPGCGKSSMTNRFINDLLDFMKEPRKDRLYSRACADQYWSRYYGQPAVLYDDLGAIAGDPTFSDYGEFIQLKTNTPYSLNMASVEEKGTMFRSKYLFSTSNNFFLDNQTNLRTPDAFYRRRDLAVFVARDPDVVVTADDPTKGMLFTILDTFTQQVKREWPSFVPLEMREMVIVNQPYRIFLAFAAKFCRAWFDVQNALVKTMRQSSEEIPAESVENILSELIDEDDTLSFEIDDTHVEEEIELFEASQRTYASAVVQGSRPPRKNFGSRQPDAVASSSRGLVSLGNYKGRAHAPGLLVYSQESLISLFDSFEFNATEFLNSLESEIGFPLFDLRLGVIGISFDNLIKCFCSCKGKFKSACRGEKFFSAIRERNFCVKSDGPHSTVWLSQGVHESGVPFFCLRDANVSPGLLFLGILQIISLGLRCQGCPGSLVYGELPISESVGISTEDIYKRLDEVTYVDMLGESHQVLWFKSNIFKKDLLPVYGLNGFPLVLCSKKVWISQEAPDRPFDWENAATCYFSILARSEFCNALGPYIAALTQVDKLVLRQMVRTSTLDLMTISKGDEKVLMDVGTFDLGRDSYAWVVVCLSLVSRCNYIRARDARAKVRRLSKAEAQAAVDACEEMEAKVVEEASTWHRNLLKYAGITAGVLAGGAMLYGLFQVCTGLFGRTRDECDPVDGALKRAEEKVDFISTIAEGWKPVTGEDFLKISDTIADNAVVVAQASSVCSAASASTYPGDETKKKKKEGKWKKANARGRFGQSWKSERQDGELGFFYDPETGLLEGDMTEAIIQFHACVARSIGVEVEVPKYLSGKIGDESPVCGIIANWHHKLIRSGALMDCPLDLAEVRYIGQDEDTITVVAGNTPIVISKDMLGEIKSESRILGRHISQERPRRKGDAGITIEGIEEVLGPIGQGAVPPVLRGEVVRKVIAQGSTDDISYADEAINQIWPKLRNACQMLVNKTRGVKMFCLAIVGSWVLVPVHFVSVLADGDIIVLVGPRRCTEVEFHSDRAFLVSQYQDLMLIDLGPRCPLAADITKFIISEAALSAYKPSPGYNAYVTRGKVTRELWQILPCVDRITMNVEVPTTHYDTVSGSHLMISGFRYPGLFSKGFCGTPIISAAGELGSCRIVGIHTAGSMELQIGYAECITRESLWAVINSVGVYQGKAEAQAVIEKMCDPPGKQMLPRPMEMPELGVLSNKYYTRGITSSEIHKSPIFGLFKQIETEPSILSSADPRLGKKRFRMDPLQEAVEKYGEHTRPFRRADIRSVERALCRHFAPFENSENMRRVLSLDEAVNGFEGSDTFLPIRMDTSPGYPWIQQRPRGHQGKWFLFEEIDSFPNTGGKRFAVKNQELLDSMREAEVNARQGILSFPLGVENAKDERRKLKKIYEAPATRAFTTLECGTNLLYRKYFLAFAAAVMGNFRRTFCKVGINPYSLDWSNMVLRMLEKSPKGFAGDYAKFDGIGDPEMYMSICEVINNWYGDGEENAQIRRTLFMGVFHRHTLVRNTVVEVDQGIPSGFSMTVIVNSMINIYYLGIAWISIMEQSPFYLYAKVDIFLKDCYVATYGDDNVLAVPEPFLEFFNLRTVAKFLSRYGIVYTDDQKNPIEMSEPYVDILSCTFLKRGFRKFEAGMLFVAPLATVSVEEQCNWVRGNDGEGALEQNVNNAVYEASLHGKEYFKNFTQRLSTAYSLVGMEYKGPTWNQCLERTWLSLAGNSLQNVDVEELVSQGALEEDMLSIKSIRVEGELKTPLELLDLCQELPGMVIRTDFVNGSGRLVRCAKELHSTLRKYNSPVGSRLNSPLIEVNDPVGSRLNSPLVEANDPVGSRLNSLQVGSKTTGLSNPKFDPP